MKGDAGGVYVERASVIPGAAVWQRTAAPEQVRVLPDGCMDLMWVDGELLIAGPDTKAMISEPQAGGDYVGLRFAPGVGPDVFGVPAHELRDQRVPLAAVWPSVRVRQLSAQLADGSVGSGLERIAVSRLRDLSPSSVDWPGVARLLRRGGSVGDVAGLTGLGERQLHRKSLAVFGYGPKMLSRILRFGDALELARAGVRLADVAVGVGYADQAHLARDARALAGVSMSALLD